MAYNISKANKGKIQLQESGRKHALKGKKKQRNK